MFIRFEILAILIGVGLGFGLASILRRRHGFMHGHATLWGGLFGAVVIAAFYAIRFVVAGELFNPEIADGIQAAAAVLSFVASLFLTILTIFYASETRAMARAAEETARTSEQAARAAVRSADIAERQQRAATRPVIAFRLLPAPDDSRGPRAHEFVVEVDNVGLGPALDTWVEIVGPLRYQAGASPVQPMVAPKDQRDEIEFRLNIKQPFTDPSLPGWPRAKDHPETRDAADATHPDATHLDEDEEDNAGEDTPTRQRGGERLLRQQRVQFLEEMATAIDRMPAIGALRATYKDIAGEAYITVTTISVVAEGRRRPRPERTPSTVWHDHLHHRLRLESMAWGRDEGGIVTPMIDAPLPAHQDGALDL